MQPIIGISTAAVQEKHRCFSKVCTGYARAVTLGGGLPVLLPILPENEAAGMAEVLSGLLLTGGNEDIDPQRYSEDPAPECRQPNLERDAWELAILSAMQKLGRPVLGICRGCQLINVGIGGSLVQSVEHQISNCLSHDAPERTMDQTRHTVTLDPSSRLAAIFGRRKLSINSFHRQAVKRIAPGLRVSGVSDDGVIEAIEGPGPAFLVGVQWHPEALVTNHPDTLRLFSAFIAAADAMDQGKHRS